MFYHFKEVKTKNDCLKKNILKRVYCFPLVIRVNYVKMKPGRKDRYWKKKRYVLFYILYKQRRHQFVKKYTYIVNTLWSVSLKIMSDNTQSKCSRSKIIIKSLPYMHIAWRHNINPKMLEILQCVGLVKRFPQQYLHCIWFFYWTERKWSSEGIFRE